MKRYRYRAYPTAGQRQRLARTFGCARVVFNDFIAAREADHKAGREFMTLSAMQTRILTHAKLTPERAWLAEVSSTPLQQSIRDADRAYRNFFNSLSGKRKGARMGRPRFKKRTSRQSAKFTRQARFKVTETTHGVGHVLLPKIGRVRFNLSRPLPSEPSSVTVILEPDGRYYLSFVVKTPTPDRPASGGRGAAGVDLGLTHLASIVTTNGGGTRHRVNNPRYLRAKERRLARAQRSLSRKQKGSNNRTKQRRTVARLHAKVRAARLDHAHKTALDLVRKNHTIAVESLSIPGLARTRMAKSVHDAGWGQFLRLLTEKADEHGTKIVPIGRFEPTSQVCSACGVKDGPKPLNIRHWTCTSCGAHLDRDYNAAVNIMVAAGLAEALNACGGNVRLTLASAVPSEAGTHRTEAVA